MSGYPANDTMTQVEHQVLEIKFVPYARKGLPLDDYVAWMVNEFSKNKGIMFCNPDNLEMLDNTGAKIQSAPSAERWPLTIRFEYRHQNDQEVRADVPQVVPDLTPSSAAKVVPDMTQSSAAKVVPDATQSSASKSSQDDRFSPAGRASAEKTASDKVPAAKAIGLLAQEDVVPTICMIGGTGTGKSSTGNTFFKRRENDLFAVSEQMTSMTSEPQTETHPWRASASQAPIRAVDTPGLGDSEGRDSEHVQSIAQMLKDHVKHVNVFMIFFNSQDRKLTIHHQEMLKVFRDSFGEKFMCNVMICFTHWEYDRRSKLKKNKKGITKESNARMINEQMSACLGRDCDAPCVFLDNTLNECDEEELKELYEDEWPAVLAEFESELDKVQKFMLQSEPFFCQDVEAALAATDALRQAVSAWLSLSQLLDLEVLGRRLILAEQDVISKGWLRWRRRRIWGVLRRQHLRFYSDESCSEAAGPVSIDLTGCICVDRIHMFGLGHSFIVYTPMRVDSFGGEVSRSELTPQEFRVESQKVCKRWVLLVGEATQISESCHRIQKLYETLKASQTEQEYVKAVEGVSNKTMVIPVEWVRQLSLANDPKAHVPKPPTLKQVEKDLARDEVMVETTLYKNPRGDDLAIAAAKHIVKALSAEAREADNVQSKAMMLARDVILSCSRTEGGGDTFDALGLLFGGDLVHLVPEAKGVEPISVHVFHEKNGRDGEGSATGVPEFLGDDSAGTLALDRVRDMNLDSDQKLQMTQIDSLHWVPDHEVPQCMRCGVQFSAWLRRHHCRACGALICFSCSRHSVHGVRAEEAGGSRSSLVRRTSYEDPQGAGDAAAGPFFSAKAMRVCFLCYQKAVIEDLRQRKEVGGAPAKQAEEEFPIPHDVSRESETEQNGDLAEEGSAHSDVSTSFAVSAEATPSSSTAAAATDTSFKQSMTSEEPEDMTTNDFPAVSIEMGSRYKVCSQNPTSETDAVLFSLDCRYVRIVRWSGLADSGRIFISIVPK